jgi:hypothetical protein
MERGRRLEAPISARLSPAEGRRFAFTVGGVFLLLAAIGVWRGRSHQALVFGGLGTILMLAGLIIPGRLGPVLRAWLGLGHLMSKVTAPVFLGLVYFAVLTPIGVLMRLFGRRPLERPAGASSWWVDRALDTRQRTDMQRQF